MIVHDEEQKEEEEEETHFTSSVFMCACFHYFELFSRSFACAFSHPFVSCSSTLSIICFSLSHTQAKELEDQLKQLLKTLGAVVIRGDDYVEVRPAGVSKGDFISHLLGDAYVDEPPGFVLCVGDDLSDEKSYVTVRRFMRTAAIAASLAGLTPGGSWGPTRSTGTRSGPPKDLLTPSFAATDAATAATAANASGGGAGAGAAPTAAPAASAAAPVAPPSPRGPSGPQEPVYFTATVGKKPTVADSYMHQVNHREIFLLVSHVSYVFYYTFHTYCSLNVVCSFICAYSKRWTTSSSC